MSNGYVNVSSTRGCRCLIISHKFHLWENATVKVSYKEDRTNMLTIFY